MNYPVVVNKNRALEKLHQTDRIITFVSFNIAFKKPTSLERTLALLDNLSVNQTILASAWSLSSSE